jgi:hypothetical protein
MSQLTAPLPAVQPLTDKYRPQVLADVLGQPWVTDQLSEFVARPYSCAFLFGGDTGTGKTSTALVLAAELGVDVDAGEFGGLWQIASGEQTGQSVREMMAGLRVRPWSGSGWKGLIVNEADAMTPNAAYIWLDALENLPLNCVVIFTTNHASKLPARLRDRCEGFHFESGALLTMPAVQELIGKVWAAEGGVGPAPDAHDLGVTDEAGNVSFRRAIQKLAPLLRQKAKVAPTAVVPAPVMPSSEPAQHAVECNWQALGVRYLAGESSHKLARECGLSETTLRGRLNRTGFKRQKAVMA